ncbi:hypothetical protein H5410_008877 [Solanum commersonii]|uniref:Uncharacterized protein n=1 Tax=Solanum commersonii TaxID=4109 RepID=A0A9J6AH31_SOLCO|nr:hypothetical protein H5410_008877 [Solanum commersonii]
METMEESIDNKSQRLFKIRAELAKLSEQAQILQSEINHLMSNLRENINPNKVAGDVPLAPSAQNISKVGK